MKEYSREGILKYGLEKGVRFIDIDVCYGDQLLRNQKHIITLQGLEINDILKITIDIETNLIIFHFINSDGKVTASHVLGKDEKFVIGEGMFNTPQYIFD